MKRRAAPKKDEPSDDDENNSDVSDSETEEEERRTKMSRTDKPSIQHISVNPNHTRGEDEIDYLYGVDTTGFEPKLVKALENFYRGSRGKIQENRWIKALNPKRVVLESFPAEPGSQAECQFKVSFKGIRPNKVGLTSIWSAPMVYEMGDLGGFGAVGTNGTANNEVLAVDKSSFYAFMDCSGKKFTKESYSRLNDYHLLSAAFSEKNEEVVKEIFWQMFKDPKVQMANKLKDRERTAKLLKKKQDDPEVEEEAFKIFYENGAKPWEHLDKDRNKKVNVDGEEVPMLKFSRKSFYAKPGTRWVLPEQYANKPIDWWKDRENVEEALKAIVSAGLEYRPLVFRDSQWALIPKLQNVNPKKQPLRNNTVVLLSYFYYVYSTSKGYGVKLFFSGPMQIYETMKPRLVGNMGDQLTGGQSADQMKFGDDDDVDDAAPADVEVDAEKPE